VFLLTATPAFKLKKNYKEYGPVAGIQGRGCGTSAPLHYCMRRHTDKKENKIFLIYKEIQNGAVAKSYMTKGLLLYEEILRISSHIRKIFATAPL
jgi:hypothetical protein